MRKTISRFTSSFAALIADRTTVIDADGRTENIRAEMLLALTEITTSPPTDTTEIWARIVRAADIQTLWYLRSDLLRHLSDFHGEQSARIKLDALTEMFRGIVHKNQMPGSKRMGKGP